MVRRIYSGRVVNRVGVAQAPGSGEFNSPELCCTEVAAFTQHFTAQFPSVYPDRVIGPVADFFMAFGGGLDVGSDATVPEQVHWSFQYRVDQFVWTQTF